LFDTIPPTLNPNVTGWLVYDSSKPLPAATNISEFNPFDDFSLVPQDKMALMPAPDQNITVGFHMGNLGDGSN
jgi:iron transport multicopper oxidase